MSAPRVSAFATVLVFLAGLLALLLIPSSGPEMRHALASSGPFEETFDGAPVSPMAWTSPNWDINYHTRASTYWYTPETVQAQHGSDCSAPPNNHTNNSWPGSVFQCNNHVMTTLNATDYGLIYLTPNAMVDFSDGPATVQWDMSTERLSIRDWTDLMISPWEYNQATTLLSDLSQQVDLNGWPKYAVHVGLDNGDNVPIISAVRNGTKTSYGYPWNFPSINAGITSGTNEAAVRQTFRLTLEETVSGTYVKFERLASATATAVTYVEGTIPSVGFTTGVVQFGHHSYNPYKDNSGVPGTWHWDNVIIDPHIPFQIVKGDQVIAAHNETITLDQPAPADAYLRFSAVGTPSVSFDGGSFSPATRQWESQNSDYHASSYWHPIPEGTEEVTFQFGARGAYSGPYIATGIAVWAEGEGTPLTPTPTDTPGTETPTATDTPTDTPTATFTPTATPTPGGSPVECRAGVYQSIGGSWVSQSTLYYGAPDCVEYANDVIDNLPSNPSPALSCGVVISEKIGGTWVEQDQLFYTASHCVNALTG